MMQQQFKRQDQLSIIIKSQNIEVKKKFTSFLEIYEQIKNEDQNPHLVYKSKSYTNATTLTYQDHLNINYILEKTQLLTFKLYVDDALFGEVKNISLLMIVRVGDDNFSFIGVGNNQGKCVGKLILTPILIPENQKSMLKLDFKAKVKDQNKEYFFKISRKIKKHPNSQPEKIQIYCSDELKPDSSIVKWPSLEIMGAKLCSNNFSEELTVAVYTWGYFWIHTKIGEVKFKIKDIKGQQQAKNIENTISLSMKAELLSHKTFLLHLQSGLEISSSLAIDYTESNKIYTEPSSKHYFSEEISSDYEKVIEESLEAMLKYDTDKKIPVFGFGSFVNHPNYNTGNQVSHKFPLSMNLNENEGSFSSFYMIREAYRYNMNYLKFAGPTFMAPLMQWQIQEASKVKNNYKYFIIFIITDGQFQDYKQMVDLVVKCNYLPISTVFIGIGDQDFTILERLSDNNLELVDSYGQRSMRDSVSYVKFESWKHDRKLFQRKMLEQIPTQIQNYFQLIQQRQAAPSN